MTISQRLAIVALVALAGLAAWLNFTSVDAEFTQNCGTWFAPELTAEEAEKKYGAQASGGDDTPGVLGDMTRDLERSAARVIAMAHECDAARSDRRTLGLLALGAVVLVPTAIVFVGGGVTRGRQG